MDPSLKKVITDYFKLIAPSDNKVIIVTYLELINKWQIVLVCPADIYGRDLRKRLIKSIERRLKVQMRDMFPYEFDVIISRE